MIVARHTIGGIDAVDDFSLNANFHRELQHILDAVDLSLDQRLERLAGLLNRLEPALLEQAAAWADEEIERAFVEFVASVGTDQGTPPRRSEIAQRLGRRGGVPKARPTAPD